VPSGREAFHLARRSHDPAGVKEVVPVAGLDPRGRRRRFFDRSGF
jgi:hypothetical protein